MPYIKREDRGELDHFIYEMVNAMQEADGQECVNAGMVNYVITRVVAWAMKPTGTKGWSYGSLSKSLAVFRDAEAEMRRRLMDPYEDKKIHENGDIREYE